jgi:hypothetical protein
MATGSRSGKKAPDKKLNLKKRSVKDLEPKQSGSISGGQAKKPPTSKPIEPVG